MKITQFFTATGLWGVVLLFIGPVITGYGYLRWFESAANVIKYRSDLLSSFTLDITIMAVGGMISLSSLPMMIIGREFHGIATTISGTRIEPN